MSRTLTILLISFALAAGPACGGGPPAETFSGSYDWKDGGSDTLQAVFKPAADGSWKIKFIFQFSGKRRSWKGSATGSLEDGGTISGSAGWKGRSWEFEGSVENGVLRGSHTEIQQGGIRYETGTFELRR